MKPKIQLLPYGLGVWWICRDDRVHGMGRTPREAYFQWFAWKTLGIRV